MPQSTAAAAYSVKMHNRWTTQTHVIGKNYLWDLGIELGFFIVTGLMGVIYRNEER